MTVYLAMRGKYTCNSSGNNASMLSSSSSSSSSIASSLKSSLMNNYMGSNSSKEGNNSSSQRVVTIVLLNSTYLDFNYDNKTTVNELFERICSKLQLKESDVFGLAQKTKDEYYFLPATEKLYKYSTSKAKVTSSSSILSLASSSASSSTSLNTSQQSNVTATPEALDDSMDKTNSGSSFKLYFRVQFYLTGPLLLKAPESRHLYYLQLKENFLTINHNMSQEAIFKLVAIALQADYGNFNPEIHKGNYFDINQYFPKWIINKLGENCIMKNIPSFHTEQSNYNYNEKSAQIKYCWELSNNEDCPFNLHLYSVCKTKDETNPSICLGIAPTGILVFEVRHSEISLISTFPWSSVTKLNCDKKKFEITISIDAKSRRYSYFTNCEKKSKYLFELSKITHSFTVNIFSRLADQKTLANYVTESYKETMFMINDNSFENYQEREICVPASTTKTTLQPQRMTIPTTLEEGQKNEMSPVIAKTPSNYDDDKLSSTNSLSSTQSDIRLSSVNSDSTSGIISDDSSRDSRQNRKRIAQFSSDNIDCNDLLRKYSSLSCNPKFETYIQQHQSTSQHRYDANDTNNNNTLTTNSNMTGATTPINTATSPSSTSSSSVSSASLAHSQTNMLDGVPMKIKKSSVPQHHLHSAQSCYSNMQAYYQPPFAQQQPQHMQQQHQQFLLPNAPYNNHNHVSNGLDYRQTFSATTQTARIKSTPPPPYLFNSRSGKQETISATTTPSGTQIIRSLHHAQQQQHQQQMNNFTLLQHYSDSNLNEPQYDSFYNRHLLNTSSTQAIMPPYVEYKKPPSYQESVQRIKHSKDSSMSSTYNEQSSSSTCTSPVNMDDYENSTLNSNSNSDTFKNYDRTRSDTLVKKQSIDCDEEEKLNQSINKITIDEKNLEQIRMKAASMSLPLLTALCSDKSLIRCLSKRDETNNKQVS